LPEHSIVVNTDRSLWDSFLANNSLGNLWQSIEYGDFAERLYSHTRTYRLTAVRGDGLESIAQGIFSKFFGFGTDMTIREGPVLSSTSGDKSDILKSMLSSLEHFGVSNHIMRMKIMWPSKWGYTDIFSKLGYENVGTNIIFTVDLSNGAEDLWKRIYGNKRRNIKKAISNGVEFIETSSFEDIDKFYNLLLDVAARDNFVPAPLSYFQTIWKSRSQKDKTKIFLARWKDNNISSVFATIHAKTIYALGFGYNSANLEVRPNDFLHWKIMEWGCKQGFSKYHMGEVHPEQGVWRWKREWNGDQDPVYVFRKSISKYRLAERVYDYLKKRE
jgi:hypothetical protein